MDKFRFLNWEVYTDSKKLLIEILELVKRLPREYRFEIGSQVIRSGLSVSLNIAEGSGKTSDKELNRFINISLGSINETLAIFDILKDGGFINKSEFDNFYKKLDSISSQLGGFKKKLVVSHKS